MIEELQPYADYKASGLAWLETIPRHWRTARNGILFQQRNDTRFPDLPILEVSLRTGVRIREFSSSKRKQVMADASKYKRACAGDVAYNMMRMWQGAVGVAPVDGLVSPAYVVARPFPGTQSHYYTALFKSELYMGEIDAASRGIVKDRNRLYWAQFKQMQSLAPPPDEQAAIVRFLDHANRKIDSVVRAKRKLIGLLNEQKQVIIHRAVTRGLDPNVKFKPSGIPWLGDVPEHWEVRKLGAVADLIVSNVDKHSHTNEKRVRLCNYVDVYKNDTIHERLNFMQATATSEEVERIRIQLGDVIITKDSEGWNDIGVPSLVCYQSDDLVCGYHLAILRHHPHLITGEFLHQVITDRFVATQMHVRAKGVTRYGLSHSAIRQVLLPLPPLSEQIPICQQLCREFNTLVITISRLEREIDLLREYRTTLTAEVVTGKLDVRDAVKRLPDHADESLPADESLDDLVDDEITEEDEA